MLQNLNVSESPFWTISLKILKKETIQAIKEKLIFLQMVETAKCYQNRI